MLDNILDLIYPPVCGICGKLNSNWLCVKCEKKMKNLYNFEIEYYEDSDEKYFDEFIYLFKYEGIIRDIMLDYKFKEKSYKYRSFINFWFKYENACEIINNYDIIIPIPISKKRFKQRGYNQSSILAKYISSKTNIDFNEKILIKSKDTIAQSKLNKKQREQNIKDVYKLQNSKKILNKKILLLDDIYTTGNTVNECSKILRSASPKKIGILAITKD